MLLEAEVLGLTDSDTLRETLVEVEILGLTDSETLCDGLAGSRNTWAD